MMSLISSIDFSSASYAELLLSFIFEIEYCTFDAGFGALF